MKFQISSTKFQISDFDFRNFLGIWNLSFGISAFGFWCLKFGILKRVSLQTN